MLSRNAIRIVVPLALLIMAGAVPGLNGGLGLRPAHSQVSAGPKEPQQAPPARPKPDTEKAARKGLSDVEKAILAIDEEYVLAYNKGDSKALAAMFTEDADVVEAGGDRYQGRRLIERSFTDSFAASPGVRIAIETDAIRLLTPEVVKEEGRSLVTPKKGAPVECFFTVLYVKSERRWLISSVREDPVKVARPHDRLKDLEWMIGEWVEERPEALVRLNCRWSDDENFLIRLVTVKNQGKPVLTISQRIGWDPLAQQIRSWEFDSQGGFGEGRWSRDGGRWVIKHTGVQPDGTTASATNIMSNERPDLIRWVATDRVVGDEFLPDADANVLVRVPPAPGVKSQGQLTPPQTPNTTRNPR
jgi:uncharacterized protein (TIGR02246 family)